MESHLVTAPMLFEAIGRYVTICSCLHTDLAVMYRSMVNIDDELLRRIIGDPKAVELLPKIRLEITVAHKAKKIDDDTQNAYELLHEEMSKLFSLRNTLAHNPSIVWANGEITFHNSLTATKTKLNDTTCTIEQLTRLAFHVRDVANIIRQFIHLALTDSKALLAQCDALAAWRKKSSLPKSVNPSIQAGPPRQKRQPKPSSASRRHQATDRKLHKAP